MFHFKHFSLYHEKSTLKIGTDAVLLAASVPLFNARSVLDIGCGCGVIGLSVAYRMKMQFSDIQQDIVGVDLDGLSVREACANAAFFPRGSNQTFEFLAEDIRAYVPSEKFDLIVSNPPFFSQSLKPENALRLQSKHCDDTLPFDVLLEAVLRLMEENGRFWTILPVKEGNDFKILAKDRLFLFSETKVLPVLEREPNRLIMGFSKQKTDGMETKTVALRGKDGEYTREYCNLVKDFYLWA